MAVGPAIRHWIRQVRLFRRRALWSSGARRAFVLLRRAVGKRMVISPFSLESRVIRSSLCVPLRAHAQKKNALLLFLRADSLETATSWVSAINHAQHIAKGVNFAPRWSVDAVQSFVAAASSNFKEIIPDELPEEEAECKAQVCHALLLSCSGCEGSLSC